MFYDAVAVLWLLDILYWISRKGIFPKFKNTWFTYDIIVTCSRDGSAIISIPVVDLIFSFRNGHCHHPYQLRLNRQVKPLTMKTNLYLTLNQTLNVSYFCIRL
ncbi:hypothetical protein LXL04_020148 [Taraxacum kok-saghyz]